MEGSSALLLKIMPTHPKDPRSPRNAAPSALRPTLAHSPGHLSHGDVEHSHPTTPCGPVFSGRYKHRDAAHFWYEFGFQAIPILPGTKRTARKWTPWLKGLSRLRITRHWTEHPDHEVGFIVGDDCVVMDADSELAVRELYAIERRYGMTPLLTVKTARGEHHLFRKDATLPCKTTSIVVGGAQDRIDVKTGRTLVVLPPSTNKAITKMCGGEHA